MALNKVAAERNQRILLDLVAQPGNDVCADCKVKNPRWASYNLGIFICVNCASVHRKIGTHVTKVKSLTMDSWTREQVDVMRTMGNSNSNLIHNPNEARHPPPPNLMDGERDSEMEQYIRSKYEYKSFIDRSALVASKLGPSRSLSSVSPRDASLSSNSATASTSSAPAPKAPVRFNTTLPPANTKLPPARSSSQPFPPPSAPPQQPQLQPQQQQQPPAQPVTQPQQPPPQQQQQQAGVWNDLISLQAPSLNSSLPLQLRASPAPPLTQMSGFQQQPLATGFQPQMQPMQMQMAPTGMGMGMGMGTGGAMGSPALSGFSPSYATQMQSQFSPAPFSAPAHTPTPMFNPQPQAFGTQQQPMYAAPPSASPGLGPHGGFGFAATPTPPLQAPVQQFGGGGQPQMQMQMQTQFGTPSPGLGPQMQMQMQPGQFMPMGAQGSPQPFSAGQQQQSWMGVANSGMGMGMGGMGMGYAPQQQQQQQGQWRPM